jgi:hypothetical protein
MPGQAGEQSTVAVDKFVGKPAPAGREWRQIGPRNGLLHF